MKSINRYVNGFLAHFHIPGFISVIGLAITFIIQNPLKAQSPLLLESINQDFNYTKDTFETESTATFAYDQYARLINKTRKGPELCKDCSDYLQSQLESETENWIFNGFGKETYYSDVVKYWRKNEPQNPWKLQTTRIDTRKTTYNEDTLVTEKVNITEYPPADWQSSYTSTQAENLEYNSKRQITRRRKKTEFANSTYVSGTLGRSSYTYENDLLSSESFDTRSYYNSDTTDFTNTKITYSYNTNQKLQSKETDYDYNGSKYRSRQLFFYNISGLVTREESYYFNTALNDWSFTMSMDYEYYGSGIIEKMTDTKLANGSNYIITTTDFNDEGKQVSKKEELYNDQMVFIIENYHTITEWINDQSSKTTTFRADGIFYTLILNESNASGKPLIERFETQNLTPDSLYLQSSLAQTVYEYDNNDELIRSRETRIAYDADSLILRGWGTPLYEAESFFTSRCDGLTASKTRRQYNYIPGTEGDIEPLAIRIREFYTYTPSACTYEENEKIMLSVWPNPSSGSVNIASDLLALKNTRLLIVTSDGKMVRQMSTPITTTMNLDMTGIAPGLYIVRLENGERYSAERIVLTQ